jgi:hypothetical protein
LALKSTSNWLLSMFKTRNVTHIFYLGDVNPNPDPVASKAG